MNLLLSIAAVILTHYTAHAHFVFAAVDSELDEDARLLKIYFTEPVDLEGSMASFIAEKHIQLSMLSPNDDIKPLELNSSNLPTYFQAKIDNRPPITNPVFYTGFLDYGLFGHGDGPKKHLQYTFSAQESSTNPSADWESFFGNIPDLNLVEEDQPFMISLRNYGPPYQLAVTGVSDETNFDVCLYDGNGSSHKVGCTEGLSIKDSESQSLVDMDIVDLMNPCETYFAVANATIVGDDGLEKSMWSTTSIIFDGPCLGSTPQATAQALVTTSAGTRNVSFEDSSILTISLLAGILIVLVSLFAGIERKNSPHRNSAESDKASLTRGDIEYHGAESSENELPRLELS